MARGPFTIQTYSMKSGSYRGSRRYRRYPTRFQDNRNWLNGYPIRGREIILLCLKYLLKKLLSFISGKTPILVHSYIHEVLNLATNSTNVRIRIYYLICILQTCTWGRLICQSQCWIWGQTPGGSALWEYSSWCLSSPFWVICTRMVTMRLAIAYLWYV